MSVSIIDYGNGSSCPCGVTTVSYEYESWVNVGRDYDGTNIWEKRITTLTETECVNPCPPSDSSGGSGSSSSSGSASASDSCDCCPKPPTCDSSECYEDYEFNGLQCTSGCIENFIECCGKMIKCGEICKVDCRPPSGSSSISPSECFCSCGGSLKSCPNGYECTSYAVDCYTADGKVCGGPISCYDPKPKSDSTSTSKESLSESGSDCDWKNYTCPDQYFDGPVDGCWRECGNEADGYYNIRGDVVTDMVEFYCPATKQTTKLPCYRCEVSDCPPTPSKSASGSQSASQSPSPSCYGLTAAQAQAEINSLNGQCRSGALCRGTGATLFNGGGKMVPLGNIPGCYRVSYECKGLVVVTCPGEVCTNEWLRCFITN